MRFLLILFITMPILEMWLLIEVGGLIGAPLTIALVFLTAFLGLALLRIQGAAALLAARRKLAANELPAREIADSLFFAVGGALLLTPGFITDVIGFACLTPGIRSILIHFMVKQLVQSGRFQVYQSHSERQASSQTNRIIDGDFERHRD